MVSLSAKIQGKKTPQWHVLFFLLCLYKKRNVSSQECWLKSCTISGSWAWWEIMFYHWQDSPFHNYEKTLFPTIHVFIEAEDPNYMWPPGYSPVQFHLSLGFGTLVQNLKKPEKRCRLSGFIFEKCIHYCSKVWISKIKKKIKMKSILFSAMVH